MFCFFGQNIKIIVLRNLQVIQLVLQWNYFVQNVKSKEKHLPFASNLTQPHLVKSN